MIVLMKSGIHFDRLISEDLGYPIYLFRALALPFRPLFIWLSGTSRKPPRSNAFRAA